MRRSTRTRAGCPAGSIRVLHDGQVAVRAEPAPQRAQHAVEIGRSLQQQRTSAEGVRSGASPGNITEMLRWRREKYDQKLPKFSGDVRDWPFFIEKFNKSTLDLQLSADENLERLREALTEEARDLISNYLHHADDVEIIVAELKAAYGDPKRKRQAAMKAAREVPRLNRDMRNLSQYVHTAHNAYRIQAQCNNEGLGEIILEEIQKKLPLQQAIQWESQKEQTGYTDISSFVKWLSKLLQTAREGGYDVDQPPEKKPKVDTKQSTTRRASEPQNKRPTARKEFEDGRHRLLLATEEQPKKLCKLKCEGEHDVPECPKFLAMDVRGRIQTAKELHLCYKCLRHFYKDRCMMNPLLK